jgi:Fe-Mn family superoxide dismutase
MIFELPKLTFGYNELEPYIDATTMEIHHSKHHAAYVNNLNETLAGLAADYKPLLNLSLEEVLKNLDMFPPAVKDKIRNNAGGHYNHSLFWSYLGPKAQSEPVDSLEKEINATFGDFESFKAKFKEAGMARFGSGWVWLVRGQDQRLEIISTANQDTPLALNKTPVLAVDVWEHAYYLKYQNRRADYLNSIWNVIDWNKIK